MGDSKINKGFGGILGLVSPEPKPLSLGESLGKSRQTMAPLPLEVPLPLPDENSSYSEPEEEERDSVARYAWVLIIIFVFFIFFIITFLILASYERNSSVNAKAGGDTPQESVLNNSVGRQKQNTVNYTAPKTSATPITSRPVELLYKKPPVGGKQVVLSLPELRWIIRENIRLEAIRSVLTDDSSWYAINQFNGLVDQYNACVPGSLYRSHEWERAQREVEAKREQIWKEAIEMSRSWY